MKVFTGRSRGLGKGALNRKAKRRRGLPVVTGLAACALGVAVAAVVTAGAPTALADEAVTGAAGTQTESEFAAVEDEPQPSAASAFAVFSADDNSLTLYKRADAPVEGTAFLGKEATRVYTGIENSRSTQPWNDVAERIASVSVADAGVAPKSLYAWFFGCTSLTNVDLRGLDASGATTMAFMFSRASALESLDLSMLDTSSCTDFSDVFQDCTSLKEIDMAGWDTSKGTTFAQMLFNCKSLERVDLSPLDTSSAVSFRQMLYGCSSLAEVDLSGFKTSKATTFASMLNGCSSLTRVDVTGFDLSMFFFNCKSLERADLATTGMSKVTTLYGAFGGCSSLRSVDVSALDVASVTNFAYCFSGCAKLEKLDLSGWAASSARDVNHFLSVCASLKEVDLTGLHTEGVTDFSYFLYGCKSLKELDLTGISTASAKNGYGMFSGMTSLAEVRLGAGFSWVGGAYLLLPSAAGVPGTDGKWHSLTSGKAYLPADVPCGVEDSFSALPPATAAAEEELDASENGTAHDNLAPC